MSSNHQIKFHVEFSTDTVYEIPLNDIYHVTNVEQYCLKYLRICNIKILPNPTYTVVLFFESSATVQYKHKIV